MAITDFHFLLLYHDRICAVSSLDEKLVYEEYLGLVSLLHTCATLGARRANRNRALFVSVRQNGPSQSQQTLLSKLIGYTRTRRCWR